MAQESMQSLADMERLGMPIISLLRFRWKRTSKAILPAMEEAGVTPEQVDYINAHGTSTHHNDLFETKAILEDVWKCAAACGMNSTKSMISHLLQPAV